MTHAHIVEALNELLTFQRGAVHEYFLRAKACDGHGDGDQAGRFREWAVTEMGYVAQLMDLVLARDRSPRLRHVEPATLGVTAAGHRRFARCTEERSTTCLRGLIELCITHGDQEAADVMAPMLVEHRRRLASLSDGAS